MLAEALAFDPTVHRYSIGTRELISVTQALTEAGLIDTRWFTPDAAVRGSYVHEAILMAVEGDLAEDSLDPVLRPYYEAYQRFLLETGFCVDGCEERLCDATVGVAGTLDLRGGFPGNAPNTTNVIDIKTGAVPSWVGYQTAGYARMLPVGVQPVRSRWCLQLQADGGYRLLPLVQRTDAAVFLAAVTVAQAKRGWL